MAYLDYIPVGQLNTNQGKSGFVDYIPAVKVVEAPVIEVKEEIVTENLEIPVKKVSKKKGIK